MNAAGGRPGSHEPGSARPDLRLLVVDDEEHVTDAVAEYFATLGYFVDCAASKAEAIALLDANDYSAVVTDLCLSGARRMEGLDVIAHLRSRRTTTACIVLTAYGDPGLEREARSRGADDLLQKPAPLPELARQLGRILDRRFTGNHM